MRRLLCVIVVNPGLVTFGLCTECFGKLPAEHADTVLMIGEKLIFCASTPFH